MAFLRRESFRPAGPKTPFSALMARKRVFSIFSAGPPEKLYLFMGRADKKTQKVQKQHGRNAPKTGGQSEPKRL